MCCLFDMFYLRLITNTVKNWIVKFLTKFSVSRRLLIQNFWSISPMFDVLCLLHVYVGLTLDHESICRIVICISDFDKFELILV